MNSHPKINIKKTSFEKFADVLSVCLIVGTLVYLIYSWNDLPQRIPRHFNAAGEVDGWGGKGTIWILPVIGTFVFGLMTFLSKFPHLFNYPVLVTEENAPRLYAEARRLIVALKFEIILLFSYVSWESVNIAFNHGGLGSWFIVVFLVSLFGTLGVFIYRLVRLR
jgi:uncharacterized membrane protein